MVVRIPLDSPFFPSHSPAREEVRNRPVPSLWSIFSQGVKNVSQAKDLLFKPIKHMGEVANALMGGAAPQRLITLGKGAASIKDLLAITSVPSGIDKVGEALRNKGIVDITSEMAGLYNAIFDVTKECVARGVITICKVSMKRFAIINLVGLFYSQSLKAYRIVNQKCSTDEQWTLQSFELGKSLSYVAFSLFALSGMAAPWMILASSISATVFSNIAYFYDKRVEPNKITAPVRQVA